MQTISLIRVVPAPIDIVFDEYTDHERLSDLPMAISSKVVVPGKTENGLGAIREVDCGPLLGFTEEIVGFERPSRMAYKIIAGRPPMERDGGQIDLIDVPGGTKVTWTTRLGVRRTPVLVWDAWLHTTLAVAFRLTLRGVERRALAADGGDR